jgi:hypothetical protein
VGHDRSSGPPLGQSTPDEGKHLVRVYWLVGVDLKHRPATGDWFGDFVVPELGPSADTVEVTCVTRASPLPVALLRDGSIATAEDLDNSAG